MAERTGFALSVQQPWAWLIVNGYKPVENRDWPTKIRGLVGIHAGKKLDTLSLAQLKRDRPDIPFPATFETGGIVGRARLVDCVRDHDSEWFVGEFGFVFTDAEPLPLIPCRGMLGFFRPQIAASPDGAT